jgi:hypothetical protein
MKRTLNALLVGIAMMTCGAIASAQTIYYNDFTTGSSGTSLHGMAPTLANAFAGGSSTATWNILSNSATAFLNTDGSMGGNQNTALLAFTPQAGYVYTLSATLTFTATPGNWLALGFAGHNPAQNAGSAKMTDTGATGPSGIDWMIANDATGNNEQFFSGAGATPSTGIGGSQALMSGAGTYTLTIDLDTTRSLWTISSFIDGTQLGTSFTYASNPNIAAVGIGQNTLGAPGNVKWDTFDLTASPVPEPSTFALAGISAVMFAVLRRRKSK